MATLAILLQVVSRDAYLFALLSEPRVVPAP